MAPLGRAKAAALLLLLAFGGALGDDDDQDIVCSATKIKDEGIEQAQSTRLYCWIKHNLGDGIQWSVKTSLGRVLGPLMIFFYHVVIHCRSYDPDLHKPNSVIPFAKMVRLAGINLITFQTYFAPMFSFSQPFLKSLVVICLDSVVAWGIQRAITSKWQCSQQIAQVQQAELAGFWDISTIYRMPKEHLMKISLVFFSQTILFGYYCIVMNQTSQFEENEGKPLVWLLGVVIICAVGEKLDISGKPFDAEPWEAMLRTHRPGTLDFDVSPLTVFRAYAQCACDWLTNSVFRQVLLATTPILLSTEGPLDFIKDILAIIFISTMDDIDDAVDRLKRYEDGADFDPDFPGVNDDAKLRSSCVQMWQWFDKKNKPRKEGGTYSVAMFLSKHCCRWLSARSPSDLQEPMLQA